MRFQFSPFRPVISIVVVADIAEQEARSALVNDQPDVAAYSHRPKVFVPHLIELVEAHAGIGRIELQVERRRLDGLLLVAGQSGEAVGECVGDAELHPLLPRCGYRRNSTALLATSTARSFCCAFCSSRSSSSQGQPLIAACRGGGSSAITSCRAALTSRAFTMLAP